LQKIPTLIDKKSGWLKNEKRLKRRDSAFTLTDKEALELIERIQASPNYTKCGEDADQIIRLRDQALIALEQTWFKRGGEGLSLQVSDAGYTDKEVIVTFTIEKKSKAHKVCAGCNQKNAKSANFCKKCGLDISKLEPIRVSQKPVRRTKSKTRKQIFMPYLVAWLQKVEEMEIPRESWLFPRYHYFSRSFLWNSNKYKHMTVERLNQILQRLDPTLTSCLFRYAGAENNLRKGYTPADLKEIGDWSSSRIPEIYAERKGLTPTQKRFSEDTEVS
jgi:ribosomal protein L40E